MKSPKQVLTERERLVREMQAILLVSSGFAFLVIKYFVTNS